MPMNAHIIAWSIPAGVWIMWKNIVDHVKRILQVPVQDCKSMVLLFQMELRDQGAAKQLHMI